MTPDALTQHLSLFLDVLESGSFSAAARRHPLTPSAVARRIDTLEAAVGSRLFVRSTHAVRPRPPAMHSPNAPGVSSKSCVWPAPRPCR